MAEDQTITETIPVVESEIVNMPNAPVTENSEPKIIEAEEVTEAPAEVVETPITNSESIINPEPTPVETPIESTSTAPETIVPEQVAQPEAEQPAQAQETEEKLIPSDSDIITARTDETGDKVYAVRANKRYWIKNPETLAKMGFYLGKEKKLPFSELLGFAEGKPIDMTVPGAVYPWEEKEEPISTEPTSASEIWQ